MASALMKQYKEEIAPALKEELGLANMHEVPAVLQVVLNVGYGKHVKDNAYIENVERTLMNISGQKPVRTKARLSISNFKIREGMDVGAKVTLRGEQMYDFLYKLVHLTFPRVRDFRGLERKGFDRQGNFALGIKESSAFPEITVESTDKIHPLQIVIKTSANNKEEGMLLLEKMGFPFKKK